MTTATAALDPRIRLETFVQSMFAALSSAGIPHCIVRNPECLSERLLQGHDIDLIVDVRSRKALARTMAKLRPLKVIRRSRVWSYHFLVDAHVFHIDFLVADQNWWGAIYRRNRDVLAGASLNDGLPVASKTDQALLAWMHNLLPGGTFNGKYRELVVASARAGGLGQQLQLAFGPRHGDQLARLAAAGHPEDSASAAGRYRRRLWTRAAAKNPLATLSGAIGHVAAEVRLLLRPPGATVAVLGVDGSGKTSVCREVARISRWRLPFNELRLEHMQRHVLPRLYDLRRGRLSRRPAEEVVPDPHATPAHSPLLSMLVLSYYALDLWLSSLASRRQLSKNYLILTDRHLLDVLLDPLRYRYGGPAGFAQFIARLTPTPDLVLVLDADPATIFGRKREVSAEELVRQRAAYVEFARVRRGTRVIDASVPLDCVVEDVIAAILGMGRLREARRGTDR